jgi:hypothetical protein
MVICGRSGYNGCRLVWADVLSLSWFSAVIERYLVVPFTEGWHVALLEAIKYPENRLEIH